MTKSQSIKFLTDLGISKKVAESLTANIPSDAAETPADDIESAIASVSAHQVELYNSSDEFKNAVKNIKDKALAEVHAKAEKKIAQIAGLTAEDVKDKKFEDIAELAFAKASKGSTKDIEQVQAELIKKDLELKRLVEVEIPNIKVEMATESALLKQISSAKLRKGVAAEDMLILVKSKAAKSGYKIGVDGNGELTITTKEGEKILTEDKKNFLTSKDVLNSYLDAMIEKSNADDTDDKKVIVIDKKTDDKKVVDAGGSVVNSNLARAQAHAKALAEAKGQ